MQNIPIRRINVNVKEPDLSDSFSIRDIQDLLSGKDMVQELHKHDFFYVLALKKGKGDHEIDFTPYKINNNTIFFMHPGQVHQLTLKKGSTGYLIAFKPDQYYPYDKVSNQLLRKASHINQYHLEDNKFTKLYSIMAYMYHEYTDKQQAYQRVIAANLDIFLIELTRQQSESTSEITSTYRQERLEEFSALLATYISTHKQVSQYAEMLHLSVYQLNAITKSILGKTSSDLINEYIILEAKRYLLATSNQVNQIADHLGYEDVSYFIRFFKKHTGYSPEAFRHNFR